MAQDEFREAAADLVFSNEGNVPRSYRIANTAKALREQFERGRREENEACAEIAEACIDGYEITHSACPRRGEQIAKLVRARMETK